jgi:hypothetical protein
MTHPAFSIAKTLASVEGLSEDKQAEVLAALIKDQHVQAAAKVSDTGYVRIMSLVEDSQDPQRAPLIKNILARCRRLGVDFDPSEPVNVVQLEHQLKGKPIDDRVSLKTAMAVAGLIP